MFGTDPRDTRRATRRGLIPAIVTCAIVGLIAAAVAGCGGSSSDDDAGKTGGNTAASTDLGTLRPGVLKVAIEPYAPYTSMSGGKQVGLEADMLNAVAKKLNLKVETTVTDFTGMISGVQTHRVDITTGGIAWSKERERRGLFTDPLYYSPTALGVTSGKTYRSFRDLEGLRLGTVTGYVWVDGIKEIPGARLHAYPNVQAIFDDLKSNRIDAAVIDPLLLVEAQQKRPDLNMKVQYLTDPPTDAEVKAHPDFSWFRQYQVAWYIPKQETKLEKAISAQIREMYENGQMERIISKYRGAPGQFLKPGSWISSARQGVDRAADWQAPSI
jgi:polar amino acid transport system substrate-binding protein